MSLAHCDFAVDVKACEGLRHYVLSVPVVSIAVMGCATALVYPVSMTIVL